MEKLYTEDRVELLFPPLLRILESRPEGIREYELMQKLGEEGFLPGAREACGGRDAGDGDLYLYRSHFFLFHVLYRLRDRLLREKRYKLSIFCLDIRLGPFTDAGDSEDAGSPSDVGGTGNLPIGHDPVATYYLDLNNMEGVSEEDVRRMISGFFDRLEAYYRRNEDLALLGLPPGATPGEIRHRYRTLAFEYHPDTGGDEERFRNLRDAAERLKRAGRI